MPRCERCGHLKRLAIEAGRLVVRCAFCVALIWSGAEYPARLEIDAALAQQNNITYSVASSSSSPMSSLQWPNPHGRPFPIELRTWTQNLMQNTLADSAASSSS